jgi:predicted dehydrogenase
LEWKLGVKPPQKYEVVFEQVPGISAWYLEKLGDSRMTTKQPIRVAIIGTAKRSSYLYGPLLKNLSQELELVSVWGRSVDSARRLGEALGVPWYTNMERLMRETVPQIGIVCVAYHANGQVGLMAVEHGLHVLLETPIAHKLSEADAIIAASAQRGSMIEVAEQFHRRPLEQIKLKLIASGLFGRVHTSFNDFAGHGYHGVSVMRSYLGFGAKPVQVVGAVRQYDLAAHWSRLADTRGPRVETQEHAIVEFEGGQLGIFHWTDVGYDSALRWWRSSRFLAEKGMGITVSVGLDVQEWLTLLAPGGEAPRFVTLERRWERVDGGALVAMLAHTGDPDLPVVRWDNPFCLDDQGRGTQWHDDEIGVAGCLMSLVNAVRNGTEPTYGPWQARLDQELILAIHQSSLEGGRPIRLPLDPATQKL